MGRRRTADGQAYTADDFRALYHTTAQEFWDNAQEVRQAPDSNWHTETEWAAEQRQAAGVSAEAPEPAREQALASPAAEQRQAAAAHTIIIFKITLSSMTTKSPTTIIATPKNSPKVP